MMKSSGQTVRRQAAGCFLFAGLAATTIAAPMAEGTRDDRRKAQDANACRPAHSYATRRCIGRSLTRSLSPRGEHPTA
jgi:hypothetical protein